MEYIEVVNGEGMMVWEQGFVGGLKLNGKVRSDSTTLPVQFHYYINDHTSVLLLYGMKMRAP